MMDGERKACTERILSAIEYGNLSNDETERRLCELVEAEVNKTDSAADMELIDACQSLLWQLHAHGEVTYESHYDQNWAQITKRLKRESLMTKTAKSVGRMLAAAAAVVFAVLGLSGNLKWSWLEHDDTDDQQQHIISGNEIAVELVQTAIAEYVDDGVVLFTEIDELPDKLNFVPIPEVLSDGWHFQQIVGTITPEMVRLDVQYANLNEESSMFYTVILFTSAEDAYCTFEQSAPGKRISILDQEVYVAGNMERMNLCWTKGLAFVRITGAIDQSEGSAMMGYILEEWLE